MRRASRLPSSGHHRIHYPRRFADWQTARSIEKPVRARGLRALAPFVRALVDWGPATRAASSPAARAGDREAVAARAPSEDTGVSETGNHEAPVRAHDPAARRVAISVLTYNRSSVLAALLRELRSLALEGVRVIVVDNHSDDDTPAVVARECPESRFVRTPANLGVSARNLGLAEAARDLVVCLDDDVSAPDLDSLRTVVAYFDTHPDVGAMNFRVVDSETGALCNWIHHRKTEDAALDDLDTYELTEGAVAFRAEALARSGFYPEHFFLAHEGPDLALRIWDSGYRVVYSGRVTVKHARSNLGRKSWASVYFNTRNQYWLAARRLPLGLALRYLARGQLSTLLYAVRDRQLRHWLRAVLDGLRGLPRALKDRRPLTAATARVVKAIDRRRPSWIYMAKLRLFRRGVRL